METIQQRFEQLGLFLPEILLPRKGIDLTKWAVIACDQFTQDKEYWEKVKNTVGGEPSALNLILPEVYLAGGDDERRIADIHRTMERYLAEGVFSQTARGCVYLERDTPFNRGRRGLVIAVDLEEYDWARDARRLVRCTEGTVAERLPPRMNIRRGAALESTHVLLLIDDKQDKLLPALAERAKKKPPIYQCPLMMESGQVNGWLVDGDADLNFLALELEKLAGQAITRCTDNESVVIAFEKDLFLFAVGDGNHSLATAKEIWEEYKRNHSAGTNGNDPNALPDHPCRYALVEIENIYDPAIQFEPIHRVVFGASEEKLLKAMSVMGGFESRRVNGLDELIALVKEKSGKKTRYGLVKGESCTLVETSEAGIATKPLEPVLDNLVRDETSLSIDYIHGEDECLRITQENSQAIAVLLPPIKKEDLFTTVCHNGPLPRKSFSMGNAEEKRFYLECRKLF